MNRHIEVISRAFSASPVEGLVMAALMRRADEADGLIRARDLDADLIGQRADARSRARRAQILERSATR